MKGPVWMGGALLALLAFFLGIDWLFAAMIAVFISLLAASSLSKSAKHASSHNDHDEQNHASTTTHTRQQAHHSTIALDVALGQLIAHHGLKQMEKPAKAAAAKTEEKKAKKEKKMTKEEEEEEAKLHKALLDAIYKGTPYILPDKEKDPRYWMKK